MAWISFFFFLLFFILVGVASSRNKKNTSNDYLLADQNVKPWLVALSAVSTNNSGFMFAGMVAFAYKFGITIIWPLTGWIIGDIIASYTAHARVRKVADNKNILSFSGVLSSWYGQDHRLLKKLVGAITVVFLGTYAAAQFSAGGKALHVLFNFKYSVGVLMGAAIVMLYCMSGGMRASIWTDAAQSLVMILALGILVVLAIQDIGGISEFIVKLKAVSPEYASLTPDHLAFKGILGIVFFVAGWATIGFGIIGQPHIMIRFMTIQSASQMNRVRAYYYTWYVIFSVLILLVGLTARIILPFSEGFDPELAMPTLSSAILPQILIGVVLAGLFAATMSTADSQIISCSASISNDFTNFGKKSFMVSKISTIAISIIATLIALFSSKTVFALVIIAWSALASAFAPLVILYASKRRLAEREAITIVIMGLISCIAWRYYGDYELIPEIAVGISTGLLTFAVLSIFKKLIPSSKPSSN